MKKKKSDIISTHYNRYPIEQVRKEKFPWCNNKIEKGFSLTFCLSILVKFHFLFQSCDSFTKSDKTFYFSYNSSHNFIGCFSCISHHLHNNVS